MRRVLGVLVTLGVFLGAGVPTLAAAEPGSGSDILGPPPSTGWKDSQQSQDKWALARAWDSLVNMAVDQESNNLNWRDTAADAALKFSDVAADYAAKYGNEALPEKVVQLWDSVSQWDGSASKGVGVSSSPPPPTNPPASLALGSERPLFSGTFPSAGQNNYYYCGPATARNILLYRGGISAYNPAHTKPTQARLAKSGYLRTDQNTATRFAFGDMERGLNRWRSGGTTGFYVRSTAPNVNQLGLALRSSIYWNEAFAVGTVESGGSSNRYNDHPPTAHHIGHWITAYGYQNSGGIGMYADPAWKLPSNSDSSAAWKARKNVKKRFSIATATLVEDYILVRGNGIVW